MYLLNTLAPLLNGSIEYRPAFSIINRIQCNKHIECFVNLLNFYLNSVGPVQLAYNEAS